MKSIVYLFLFQYVFISIGREFPDYAWDIYLNGFIISCAFACYQWFKGTSYLEYKKRALIVIQILFLLSFNFSYILSFYHVLYPFEVLRSLFFVVLFVFVLFRKKYNSKDTINNKDLFIVRSKPKGFQDTLISLFGIGLGSFGVYYKGFFYHYKKGIFVKEKEDNFEKIVNKYIVIKSQKRNNDIICKLNHFVGSKWSLFNNCVTRIGILFKDEQYGRR